MARQMKSAPGLLKKQELVSVPSFKNNFAVLSFTRTVASVVAGVTTGLLGITGWSGFLLYLLFQALDSGMLVVKTGFDAKRYYGAWSVPLTSMIFNSTGILTFLLFWIISYNVAHVF